MKNLFNNISQDEKNRILEMHSGKKNVISEQSIDGAVEWVKDKVKSILPNSGSSFKTQATVEGDMVMEFEVVKFQEYSSGRVAMFIKDQIDGNKLLYVRSKDTEFMGPIFDAKSNTKKYTDSIFTDIDIKNWKTIAKQNNIPVSKVMV
jgi:hypothetical protein